MSGFARRYRAAGLLIVAMGTAVMLLGGPVPSSEAALTKWDTIGAGWAYGGSSRLLERPNNGIDVNQARVSVETVTALDPRRIRLVVYADELDSSGSFRWRIECVDRRGSMWSEESRRETARLPLKLNLFHAAVDGRVQACTVFVSVAGTLEEQPYELRVKVQARYAGG